MIFDYTGGLSGGNENFVNSRGHEISGTDAANLVHNANQDSLSHDLAGSSSDFSSGKYETFPQAVEATRFDSIGSGHDKDDGHDKNNSASDNSAAFVTSGGDSHTNNASHDSSCSGSSHHSSCGGNSGCSGNSSSCSGGSSCGGGGCGGGGCGGG